jgi:hypothetical protein
VGDRSGTPCADSFFIPTLTTTLTSSWKQFEIKDKRLSEIEEKRYLLWSLFKFEFNTDCSEFINVIVESGDEFLESLALADTKADDTSLRLVV